MPAIEVREVDLHDEVELHAWWQACHDAQDRAYDVYPAWEHSRVALPEDSPEHELTLLGAFDGADIIGTALLELPRLDNTHVAWVDVAVLPAHRNRGTGAALLARVEEAASRSGRTHAIGAAFTPHGGTSAGARFAAAHDYEVANVEGWKVLDLRDLPDWASLDRQVADRIGGYRLVEWENVTPEEHIDDYAIAISTFVSMVPTGELVLEDGDWTAERIRANEKRAEGRNRRFVAAAISPNGELAAYTDLTVSRAKTTQASVGITFSLPGHRGHSLGLAVKLANHRALMAALPECEFVKTSNADTNAHMNAVNEQMGYRVVEDILEVQKVISS